MCLECVCCTSYFVLFPPCFVGVCTCERCRPHPNIFVFLPSLATLTFASVQDTRHQYLGPMMYLPPSRFCFLGKEVTGDCNEEPLCTSGQPTL